jgi:hypothetical protein
MLPDLRFVVGAVLATALLVVTAFGVTTTLRLAHQAKVGPLEASRSLAYADQTDWNQFQDPTAARRFEDMTRQEGLARSEGLTSSEGLTRSIESENVQPSIGHPADTAADATQPVAPSPILETSAPVTASVAQDADPAAAVPQDGNAPIADDHATHADLEPVIVPAPATASGQNETPADVVAALDPPVKVPASIAPAIAAPAPTGEPPVASEVDRVASIPAASPSPITSVERPPPLPRAAPARRQAAQAAAQSKRVVIHHSRLFAARARAIRVARARSARARQAAQQPFAPTGFTATTGQPNNPFNNRQFNTTGFNNDGSGNSKGGN